MTNHNTSGLLMAATEARRRAAELLAQVQDAREKRHPLVKVLKDGAERLAQFAEWAEREAGAQALLSAETARALEDIRDQIVTTKDGSPFPRQRPS